MGTSSSHRGNKDKKELLPNDYVKPIVSWQATKQNFQNTSMEMEEVSEKQ